MTTTYEEAPVTKLLERASGGDEDAHRAVLPLVYRQLRAIAIRQLRGERSNHTLQPTAVVHEAYLRLFQGKSMRWRDRRHFFSVAAQTMRRILVDHARARLSSKRGGGERLMTFDEDIVGGSADAAQILEVDEALRRLQELDAKKAYVVQLRYFGGFSIEETAAILGTSRGTVVREWRFAKAWLYRELRGNES